MYCPKVAPVASLPTTTQNREGFLTTKALHHHITVLKYKQTASGLHVLRNSKVFRWTTIMGSVGNKQAR